MGDKNSRNYPPRTYLNGVNVIEHGRNHIEVINGLGYGESHSQYSRAKARRLRDLLTKALRSKPPKQGTTRLHK